MPGIESSGNLRFLLDQNVPREVAFWLEERWPCWRASHTSQVGLDGEPDFTVFTWAQANGCLIITFDEDFADQRNFQIGQHHGIIRLRVWPTTVEETENALARLFDQVEAAQLMGALVIIGPRFIRVRTSGSRVVDESSF